MNDLAESILRKIAEQERNGDMYVELYPKAACIDGWVSDLTAEEVAYLRFLGWREDS